MITKANANSMNEAPITMPGRPGHASTRDPYKEIAKGMEQEYLKFMLEKMRSTVEKEEPEGPEADYYNSLLDSEYAGIMSKKNEGKGIQDMILKQIDPHYAQKNRKDLATVQNRMNNPQFINYSGRNGPLSSKTGIGMGRVNVPGLQLKDEKHEQNTDGK